MRTLFFLLMFLIYGHTQAQQKDTTRITFEKLSGNPPDSVINSEKTILTPDQYKAIEKYETYIQDGMVQVPYEPKDDIFLDSYMELIYQKSKTPDS